jgi:hypothetical protein
MALCLNSRESMLIREKSKKKEEEEKKSQGFSFLMTDEMRFLFELFTGHRHRFPLVN